MSDLIISIPEGKVKDYIDGTFRKDTPEEYVRQTVEKRLVNEHKYSKDIIKVEYPVQMGSGKKRADIVIFHKDTSEDGLKDQHKIEIIIECKNEKVEPTDKSNGIEQLKTYMAASNGCMWGMWTNGNHKTVFRKIVDGNNQTIFEEHNDIPSADGFTEDNERPVRGSLIRAYEDNLLFTFKTCHNIIYAYEGHQKQEAFFEFLKIIFCKIHDERSLLKPVEFYTTSRERNNQDGRLSVKNRIAKLLKK